MVRFLIMLLFFLISSGTTSPVLAADSALGSGLTAAAPDARAAGGEQGATGSVDIAKELDLTQVRGFLEKIDADVQGSLPGFSLSQMFQDLKQGKLSLQPDKLGKALLTFLTREILNTGPLIGKLLILAVLCAVLQQLQSAFGGSIGKMSEIMAYLVLLGIALATFQETMKMSRDAIDQMVGLMQASFPVMLTLLLTMGNFTTAALFKPLVMGSLTFFATIVKTVVLPLFFLSAVLHLFNHISEQFKVSKLAGFMEFIGKISLGFTLTLFIGLMAIQGVTGGVADGVALRTAKYSADLIPVVGKFFKDAVELVVTSGLLIKNALGIVAIIAIAFICLSPIIKILAIMFAFRISAALIEPLGEKALADSLQSMAKSLINIAGSVATVAIMFFMTVAVVVGAGNLSVMLR
ncbi:stage III sporulation protein AE [Paradesulfitobacterium aromaticivorans]